MGRNIFVSNKKKQQIFSEILSSIPQQIKDLWDASDYVISHTLDMMWLDKSYLCGGDMKVYPSLLYKYIPQKYHKNFHI